MTINQAVVAVVEQEQLVQMLRITPQEQVMAVMVHLIHCELALL